MKKNNVTGNAIAQYSIILVLVIIACVSGYFLLGSSIVNTLSTFLGNIISINQQMDANAKILKLNELKAGELGGSPSSPKSSCAGNSCTIDFGDYILHGVPEDFGNVSSASRGKDLTQSYINMLNELANQQIPGSPEETLLRDLIVQAKKMAKNETNIDKTLININNIQTQKINKINGDFTKLIENIESKDPNNLNKEDFIDIMSDLRILRGSALISEKQSESISLLLLSAKESSPNLTIWQKSFLKNITNDFVSFSNNMDTFLVNLSENERNILINENAELFSVVTGKLNACTTRLNSNSANTNFPGRAFADLLKTVPTSGLSVDLKQTVSEIGTQISLIGDSINIKETKGFNDTTTIVAEIPETANIKTKIKDELMK